MNILRPALPALALSFSLLGSSCAALQEVSRFMHQDGSSSQNRTEVNNTSSITTPPDVSSTAMPGMQALLGGLGTINPVQASFSAFLPLTWATALPDEPVLVNGRTIEGTNRSAYFGTIGGFGPLGGDWWYDSRSGAFGPVGGPIASLLPPGLDLGPLAPDASGGQSGYFVNGRRLHQVEADFLRDFLHLAPGRYQLDEQWTFSSEGDGTRFGFGERFDEQAWQAQAEREEAPVWILAWSRALTGAVEDAQPSRR